MPRLSSRDEGTKRSVDQHTHRVGYLTAVTALVTAVATLLAATATLAALFIA